MSLFYQIDSHNEWHMWHSWQIHSCGSATTLTYIIYMDSLQRKSERNIYLTLETLGRGFFWTPPPYICHSNLLTIIDRSHQHFVAAIQHVMAIIRWEGGGGGDPLLNSILHVSELWQPNGNTRWISTKSTGTCSIFSIQCCSTIITVLCIFYNIGKYIEIFSLRARGV